MVLLAGLFELIVPEGRIGRKGKSGPLFFSFFPFLLFKKCPAVHLSYQPKIRRRKWISDGWRVMLLNSSQHSSTFLAHSSRCRKIVGQESSPTILLLLLQIRLYLTILSTKSAVKSLVFFCSDCVFSLFEY
jgi:hypothetical protein